MPSYYYRACDEQGTIFEGKEKAASEEQVLAFLQDRKLRPIQIDTRSKFKPLSFEESIAQRFPVPKQQIAVLFDQLGIMLGSGISIEEALLSVEEHTTNYRLRTSLKHIRKNVSEGIPLHTVMMDHSDIFSETIIRVVEVGEHSGQLDVSLLRLAEMLE
ncbi:hypothetical protein GF373_12940, partial [bacterium]|nr:hypothetical protein [bacterium]